MDRNKKILAGKFAAILSVPLILWAHAAGPDAHHTAVPGTGETSCNAVGCHVGTALNGGGGNVTLTSSAGTNYTPGQKQTLTVKVTDSAARRYGFQITARLASDHTKQAGTFTPGANQFVLCAATSINDLGNTRSGANCPANAPLEFAEHTSPFTSNTITVDWTPPTTATGNIDLYVSANAANFNGTELGDHIYTASLTLQPAASGGGTKPVISDGGIINALAFGGKAAVAPGTWIEIYGTNLATNTREWAGGDFKGSTAPTSLDGVSVTVAGKPAFVRFISSGQVNVQVPDDIGTGPVPVVVTNGDQASNALIINAQSAVPGILAPASFKAGDTQYAVAQLSDNSFAGDPAKIAGTTRPVKPGETIVLYGIGFGPVTPAIPAGAIVDKANAITGTVAIRFGQIQASAIPYKGLGPNFVGLYQFNVVVPANVPDGDQPLEVTLDGQPTGQTMFITVKK
jgi:uncharacterized protein (TIGR03437 family)